MKKSKMKYVADVDKEAFKVLKGFTERLEYSIASRRPTDRHITLDNVTSMPTYELAALALSKDAIEPLIITMDTMRKRYMNKGNVDDEVMGFFDCLEGEAYAYASLITRHASNYSKLSALAYKYFNSAINRGYKAARYSIAEYGKKRGSWRASFNGILFEDGLNKEKWAYMGECIVGFDQLVENASRVLAGKRALITDMNDFEEAKKYYNIGKDESSRCLVCAGLIDIIENNRQSGMNDVRNGLAGFKKGLDNERSMMFENKYKHFAELIDKVEKDILKTKKR